MNSIRTQPIMLDPTLHLAAQEGWTVVNDRVDGASQHVDIVRREGERLTLRAWSQNAQGGQGQIRSISGQIASGLVSRERVSREQYIREPELREMLALHHYTNNSGYLLRVKEGEITQHWETASNYTVHQTVPGLYPIEITNLEYQRVPDADCAMAYYAIARIATIEVRKHYVNRLFAASSAHDEELHQPSSYLWTAYAYQMPNRKGITGASYGKLYEVIELHGRAFERE